MQGNTLSWHKIASQQRHMASVRSSIACGHISSSHSM